MRRSASLTLAAGAFWALAALIPHTASATDVVAEEKPTLSLSQDEGLELVVPGDGLRGTPAQGAGQLNVTLFNSGSKEVTPEFALVREGTRGGCEGFGEVDGDDSAVSPQQYVTYELSVSVPEECIGTPATLLVTGNPDIPTLKAEVATVREVGGWDYGPPLVVSVLAGAAFAGLSRVAWSTRREYRTAGGSSWTFSGSWLTSVTAISTALAGVLAASGFVTELLPGIPLGHFLGLSLTFGGIVVAAPMAFSMFQVTEWVKGTPTKDEPDPELVQVVNGRFKGVILAGALTCAGVAGQLAMLFVLTGMSQVDEVSKFVVYIVLVGATVIVTIYVVVATKQAAALSTKADPQDPPDDANLRRSPRQRLGPMSDFTGTM